MASVSTLGQWRVRGGLGGVRGGLQQRPHRPGCLETGSGSCRGDAGAHAPWAFTQSPWAACWSYSLLRLPLCPPASFTPLPLGSGRRPRACFISHFSWGPRTSHRGMESSRVLGSSRSQACQAGPVMSDELEGQEDGLSGGWAIAAHTQLVEPASEERGLERRMQRGRVWD